MKEQVTEAKEEASSNNDEGCSINADCDDGIDCCAGTCCDVDSPRCHLVTNLNNREDGWHSICRRRPEEEKHYDDGEVSNNGEG